MSIIFIALTLSLKQGFAHDRFLIRFNECQHSNKISEISRNNLPFSEIQTQDWDKWPYFQTYSLTHSFPNDWARATRPAWKPAPVLTGSRCSSFKGSSYSLWGTIHRHGHPKLQYIGLIWGIKCCRNPEEGMPSVDGRHQERHLCGGDLWAGTGAPMNNRMPSEAGLPGFKACFHHFSAEWP